MKSNNGPPAGCGCLTLIFLYFLVGSIAIGLSSDYKVGDNVHWEDKRYVEDVRVFLDVKYWGTIRGVTDSHYVVQVNEQRDKWAPTYDRSQVNYTMRVPKSVIGEKVSGFAWVIALMVGLFLFRWIGSLFSDDRSPPPVGT